MVAVSRAGAESGTSEGMNLETGKYESGNQPFDKAHGGEPVEPEIRKKTLSRTTRSTRQDNAGAQAGGIIRKAGKEKLYGFDAHLPEKSASFSGEPL